jgi:hypothetical protein
MQKHTCEMRRTLFDLAPHVRLFLVYEFGKLRRVVTQGMREGKRKLLLLRGLDSASHKHAKAKKCYKFIC